MGYDLHITRRQNWYSEGAQITEAEWLDYIETDPELTKVPENGPHFIRNRFIHIIAGY